MPRTTTRRLAAVALATTLLVVGCAKDDGANTRAACGSGSGAGGNSAAGGSAAADSAKCDAGLTADNVAGSSKDPLVNEAVTGYQAYVEEQVNGLVVDTRTFTDAVRAGDVAAAKAHYPTSRTRWERIEPIAALIADIDGEVDARAADGVEDTESPDVTGWHQLEYDIWVKGDLSGSKELADGLDKGIEELQAALPELEITPLAVVQGATELIEEVADGKVTGEEDRYSHTDLWDLNANAEGARASSQLLKPAIVKADPELWSRLDAAYAATAATMEPYRTPLGWTSFDKVSDADRDALKAKFAALAEVLGEVPGALDLS
ncbi:MAG: ycdO [Acidimicrobiales bacterium]|nr:ycdO [Acidimicrobiales bacterium]